MKEFCVSERESEGILLLSSREDEELCVVDGCGVVVNTDRGLICQNIYSHNR